MTVELSAHRRTVPEQHHVDRPHPHRGWVGYSRHGSAPRHATTSTRSSGPRRRTSPTSSARASASSWPTYRRTSEVRRYAEAQIALLDRLGYASSKADEGPRESRVAPRLGRAPVRPRPPTTRCRGVTVFVTGGSRGIGRAIALRFARDGAKRVAIGYLRNDTAAEETAEELRALGAEPVLVRGNVTSERVLDEVAALGPLDVLVHNAATGRDPAGARDGGQALGLDAERERPRAPRSSRALAAPQMPPGVVDRRDLVARRAARARELRAVGTSKAALEALVRYLAVELARAGSASTPCRAASSRPARSSTSRTARRCSPRAARTRPAGSSSPRTSPARWRSSARPTPR